MKHWPDRQITEWSVKHGAVLTYLHRLFLLIPGPFRWGGVDQRCLCWLQIMPGFPSSGKYMGLFKTIFSTFWCIQKLRGQIGQLLGQNIPPFYTFGTIKISFQYILARQKFAVPK